MDVPHFVVDQDTLGDFRWRLVAANGKPLAIAPRTYSSERGVKRAVRTVLTTIAAAIHQVQTQQQRKRGR